MNSFLDVIKNNWFLILIGLWFIYSVFFTADRDSTGSVTKSGWVNSHELQVGDCILDNSLVESLEDEKSEYYQVWVTPCEEEHSAEIFYAYDLGNKYKDFPGNDAFTSIIDEICSPAFEDFVGLTIDEMIVSFSSEVENLGIAAFYPLEEAWFETKQLSCLVYPMNNELMIGAVKDLFE